MLCVCLAQSKAGAVERVLGSQPVAATGCLVPLGIDSPPVPTRRTSPCSHSRAHPPPFHAYTHTHTRARQDVVHEDLTVRENMAYSARLRLSAAKRAEEKAGLVDDAVDLLQVCVLLGGWAGFVG